MGILKFLLIVVEVVSSVLLVGVILLQKSRSEGLGMAFGAGMGETLFGSRAGNVLTKITITLGAVFLLTSSLLAMVFANARETSIIDQRTAPLPEASAPPARQAPGPAANALPSPAPVPTSTEPAPSTFAAPVGIPAGGPSTTPEAVPPVAPAPAQP